MSAETPLRKDHPLMIAWELYKSTEDFENTRRWAQYEAHVTGSLWAAFMEGWRSACGGRIDDTGPVAAKIPPTTQEPPHN